MASCVDLAKLLWMEIGDVPAAGGHPPISARFEICFSSFAERRACFRLDLAAGRCQLLLLCIWLECRSTAMNGRLVRTLLSFCQAMVVCREHESLACGLLL
jgi:hypothetical protein